MSTLETIEHISYEGTTKVNYDVEIEYVDTEMDETLEILSVNGLDANYISNAFLSIIKEEIIEDLDSSSPNSSNPLDLEPSLLAPQI